MSQWKLGEISESNCGIYTAELDYAEPDGLSIWYGRIEVRAYREDAVKKLQQEMLEYLQGMEIVGNNYRTR
jgi:hypothetical protein